MSLRNRSESISVSEGSEPAVLSQRKDSLEQDLSDSSLHEADSTDDFEHISPSEGASLVVEPESKQQNPTTNKDSDEEDESIFINDAIEIQTPPSKVQFLTTSSLGDAIIETPEQEHKAFNPEAEYKVSNPEAEHIPDAYDKTSNLKTIGIPEALEEFLVVNFESAPEDSNFNPGAALQISQSKKIWRAKLISKKCGLVLAAGVPPMALAVNAFCALPHIKTKDLSLDVIKALSSSTLALCITNSAFSYSINAILNYATIPPAFNMFYDRMYLHFRKHPIKNSAILLFAAGAGVSAAGIGYASVLSWGGTKAAWANFGANGFIFFVTRFYGLVNALHRFEKWWSHRFENNPLTSRAFDDLLSHVTDDCAKELEEFLRNKQSETHSEPNEITTTALLKKLDEIQKRNPNAVKDKSTLEILGIIFDIAVGAGAGASVALAFGQKFLDGLDILKALVTNTDPTASTTINDLSIWIKAPLSSLSIATSVLYAGQTSLLRQTGINAYQSIVDPKQTFRQKTKKTLGATALLAANGFAASSIFNLEDNVIHEANSIPGIVTPPDHTAAVLVTEIAGAVAGGAVNTKLTVEKVFPAPKQSTTPTITRVDSSANLPDLTNTHTKLIPSETMPNIPEGEDEKEDSTTTLNSANSSFNSLDAAAEPELNAADKKPSPEPAAVHHPLLDSHIRWLKTHTISKFSLEQIRNHHFFKPADSSSTPPAALPTLDPSVSDNDLNASLLGLRPPSR